MFYEACVFDLCLVPEEAEALICEHADILADRCAPYGLIQWRTSDFCGEFMPLPLAADLHCQIRTRIPTRTRIPVLYKYYGKGIRIWIRTNVKSLCIVLCSHRVWNPSPCPNLSPAM